MSCNALEKIINFSYLLGLLPFQYSNNKLNLSSTVFVIHTLVIFSISLYFDILFMKIVAENYDIAFIILALLQIMWLFGYLCDLFQRVTIFYNREKSRALLDALIQESLEFCNFNENLKYKLVVFKKSIDKVFVIILGVSVFLFVSAFNMEADTFELWFTRIYLLLAFVKIISSCWIDIVLICVLCLIESLLQSIQVSTDRLVWILQYQKLHKLLETFIKCFQIMIIINLFNFFLGITYGLYKTYFYISFDFSLNSVLTNLNFFISNGVTIVKLIVCYKFDCACQQVSLKLSTRALDRVPQNICV